MWIDESRELSERWDVGRVGWGSDIDYCGETSKAWMQDKPQLCGNQITTAGARLDRSKLEARRKPDKSFLSTDWIEYSWVNGG